MTALSNPRHERFAQELAKGKPAVEAYKEAGYSAKTAESNAYRLMDNYGISVRVREIQERGAIRADVTIQDLIQMAHEDREFARKMKNASAFGAATERLAKLTGNWVDRQQLDARHTTVTDEPMKPEDWQNEYTSDARH